MGSSPLWLSVTILVLASIGIVTNIACFAILTYKRRSSKFHNLLKLLSLFDIMVILGCTFLYALPGIPWDAFTLEIYPRCLPFILPLTQICLMSSVYCTILMSFERYVRICHLCQLRYNSWLSEGTFGTLIAFVTLFPVCFYMPRFFEMRSKEEERPVQFFLDCNNYTMELHSWHTLGHFKTDDDDPILHACANVDYQTLLASNMLYISEKTIHTTYLESTWLGENKTYQFVYASILNTTFATAIPLFLLFYLNLTTVHALSNMKRLQRPGTLALTTEAVNVSSSARQTNTEELEQKEGNEGHLSECNHISKVEESQILVDELQEDQQGTTNTPDSASQGKWRLSLNRKMSSMVRLQHAVGQDSMHATENRLTRISLAIVWMFIFCHVWKLIPTMYEALTSSNGEDWPHWLHVINDISHSLIVFNSAVNFLIYSIL